MDTKALSKETIVDDRYVIVERLGAGGMGTVYKAFEKSLNRIVALKFLHPWLMDQDDHLRRFELEGKILCSLVHGNILRCYRFGIYEEISPYLVMEYLEGRNLRQILDKSSSPLNAAELLRMMLQICDGLALAHKQGILHRDLKPENIFVEEETDTPKILDFGLAKVVQGTDSGQKKTKTGALVGTVQYMSPEQCTGNKADERSDIYSLSCILFECLTGEPAFEADNPIAFLHMHVNAPRPILSGRFPPGAKLDSLQHVLNKGLAVDPKKRYQTMLEMKDDLQLIADGQYKSLFYAGAEGKGRSTRAILLATAGGFVILAALFFFWKTIPWATVEKNIFFQNRVHTASIIERMQELIRTGKASDAELYLPELESALQSSRSGEDFAQAVELAVSFKTAGQIESSKELDKTIMQAIDRIINRKDLDIKVFNKLAALELQIAARDRHSREYRATVKKLFGIVFDRSYYVDHDLALDLSKRYLDTLFEKPEPDLLCVHSALLLRMKALQYKQVSEVELEKARKGVLASSKVLIATGNKLAAVEALGDVASGLPADLAEPYYLEAVSIQDQSGSKGKKELLSRVAVNQCQVGKHQQALDFLREAQMLANKERNINLKEVVYRSTVSTGAVGLLRCRISTLMAREFIHTGKVKEARSQLDDAMDKFRSVELFPSDRQFSLLDLPFISEENFLSSLRLDEPEKGEEAFRLSFERAKPAFGEKLAAYPEGFKRLDLLWRNWLGVKWAFQRILQRNPNSHDWTLLLDLLNKKDLQASEIVKRLMLLPEFKARLKGLSKPEQIELLYTQILERQSDLVGSKFWLDVLEKQGINVTLMGFADSAEARKLFADQMTIDKLVLPWGPVQVSTKQ